MRWSYPPELMEVLLDLGLRPTPETPPAVVRAAVNDLYRLELVRLRDARRAGRVPRTGYADRVVALRRRYWPLTLSLPAWERICETMARETESRREEGT